MITNWANYLISFNFLHRDIYMSSSAKNVGKIVPKNTTTFFLSYSHPNAQKSGTQKYFKGGFFSYAFIKKFR